MIGTPLSRPRRDGVILVVVVSLLALFAVVGLGYVIYAESQATASRLQRESQVVVDDKGHLEPELVLNRALAALIYDHPDDQTGVYSALRGHSLARNMYGQREMLIGLPHPLNPRGATVDVNTNIIPFNGTGIVRVSEPTSVGGLPRPLSGLPRDQILNFTYFNRTNVAERDPIIRMPEHYPVDPNNRNNYWTALTTAKPPGNLYFGGANAPYTYPDHNNAYLAAVRASDGQVLIPSFHRPYLFLNPMGATDPTFLVNTTHPDWYTPKGRLRLMRPRPIDQVRLSDPRQQQIWQANGNPPFPPQENPTAAHLTQYSNATQALINAGYIMPYPSDVGGDVKNLLGGPGGNDSVWLDIGLPVRVTKSGKKFKPLVSFLITDLDGRINLNIHGNLRGQPGGTLAGVHLHASNQGLGRHEVNPMHVLTIAPGEHQNLFQGFGGVPGRYTNAVAPTFPRPIITIGNQQVDLSQYAASFLNPPVFFPPLANEVVTTTEYQIGAGPAVQDRTQLSRTITFPNSQYDPPYMRIDFDGANEQLPSRSRSDAPYARNFNPALLQQQPLLLSSFPDYHTSFAGTPGAGYGNESAFPVVLPFDPKSEQFQSAFLFNPLRNTGNSRLLDAMETHNMIARYNSPLNVGDSLLSKLLPQNLSTSNPLSAAIRHRITLVSADVGRTGWTPQTFQRTTGAPSAWGITNPLTIPFAQQGEFFPQWSMVPAPGTATQPGPSDFAGNSLFIFSPNPGGSILPIRDASGNLLSSFDGRAGAANYFNDGQFAAGQPSMARSGTRLDLNRALPAYPRLVPAPAADGMSYQQGPATSTQVTTANDARQEFAQEIFERLCLAVGAPSMNPPPPSMPPNDLDYKALKYLAQLAVNIVDDIDEDDVMTAFRWQLKANPANLSEVVYGVEMPKVVINEIYVEQTNGDGGPDYLENDIPPNPQMRKRVKKFQINTWVELHHTMVPPFAKDMQPAEYARFVDRHRVFLKNNLPGLGQPVSTYRMMLVRDPDPAVPSDPAFPEVELTPGNWANRSPDEPEQSVANKIILFTEPQTGGQPAPASIDPIDTSTASGNCTYRCTDRQTGFYVCGPNVTTVAMHGTMPPIVMGQPESFKSQHLSYESNQLTVQKPTVVLQRLANPYLQHDPISNPYVTVDVMRTKERAPEPALPVINRRYDYNNVNTPAAPLGAPDDSQKRSVMRKQPFAGAQAHLRMSTPSGNDKFTFFAHNGNSSTAMGTSTVNPPAMLPDGELERFDWYIHHDRKLVSPMELIHVAAVAPWDVTQNFIRNDLVNAGQKIRQGHTAPWFDQFERYSVANPQVPYTGEKVPIMAGMGGNLPTASARLYRALEQFRVGDRTVEMAFGGRDLGKININTIWDQETFRALCDAWVDPSNPTGLDYRRGFTQGDVDYAWLAMTDQTVNLTARSPMFTMTGTYTQITGRDRPFHSPSSPHMDASQQYPPLPTGVATPANIPTSGIETTIFRSFIPPDPTPMVSPFKRKMMFDAESQFNFTPMNQPAVQHPLMEKALLSKIYEHVTTRSNVFGVYMTVGYFEVTDDTQKPELLGDEIGVLRDAGGAIVENKAIRHRMFAIVDRTNLTLQPPRFIQGDPNWERNTQDLQKQGPAPFYYTSPVRLTPGGGVSGASRMWRIQLPITSFVGSPSNALSVTGTYNGMSWQLRGNDVLFVGSGSEQRRLVVWPQIQVIQEVAADGVTPIFTALIRLGTPPLTGTVWPNMDEPPPHPVLITNAIAGHPGPQPDFDHKMPNYRGVVLYSVIMD